ncbi:hypothetical protein GJ842_19685 [Salmonella enterica]|nr:hypothetical protein [Salmonella enterica]EBR4920121.1 hypothetical protein [Salmonella enterica]EDZ9930456.1 hypothetical protein [Salmonella enterica]EEE7366785.1 hypothetical protein [Salmonella enterica subsp. enterica serovar Berta]EGC1079071.1 hypothetical protein [Salmonella enterica]
MIITNANTLGEQSGQATATTPNLADLISGRFGLLHAKDAPVCASLDTAMIGYMLVTPDTQNNPQSGDMAFGMVRTLDSFGAGDDGQRTVPPVGSVKEWITQILFMADGSLYTRTRVNDGAFKPFVKRW